MMEMRWHIGKYVRLFAAAAGVLFVSALLLPFFPRLEGVMELGFRLALGWLAFLVKVVPPLRLDVAPVLYGVFGFGLTCFAMHAILRTLRAQQKQAGGQRWKHSVCMTAGVSIMLGLGFLTSEIVENMMSFPRGNWVQQQWSERAFTALNKGRANHIAGQIRTAAEENDGRLPFQFHDIWGEDRASEAADMMPFRSADPTAMEELWIYLGGTELDSAGSVPVLAAPRTDKNGKRIVAFLDTTVAECTEEEWQAALQRWRHAMESGRAVSEANR